MSLRIDEDQELPYKSQLVTLINVKDRTFSNEVGGKREMVQNLHPNSKAVIAVWTGQYRSDAFEIDVKRAKEIFG